MSAAELLLDLGRLGIRLEAEGESLLYSPRSALTPDLLARLKAHKADLLAMLRPAQTIDTPTKPARAVCRCDSTTWRDVPIHGGQSVRRDCGRCGRFLDFPTWHGKGTGHNGQHSV